MLSYFTMVTISRFERLQGLTNDWRDVETAEVGCWAVIDFTFCVQMAISIIGGTASFPQTVHVHPVTRSLWLGWISTKIKHFISNFSLINNNRKAASYSQIPSTGQFSQKQRQCVSFKFGNVLARRMTQYFFWSFFFLQDTWAGYWQRFNEFDLIYYFWTYIRYSAITFFWMKTISQLML